METASIWSDAGATTGSSFNAFANDSHFTPQPTRTQSRWLFNSSPGWNIAENNSNAKLNQSNGSFSKSFNSTSSSSFEAASEPQQQQQQHLPPSSRTAAAHDATAQDFLHRYKQLKNLESIKNELIEELLLRYDSLNEQFRKLSDDHDRECEYNRSTQRREKSLQDNIRRMQYHVERDPFALVLIDGNSLIFNDHLLNDGEAGGREAAAMLNAQIIDCLRLAFPVIQAEMRVVTRIYANVRLLGETCYRAGLVDRPDRVEEFVRGFTSGGDLFDFIDIGTMTNKADNKISELIKLHLYDYHCRHIFFGGSQGSCYANLLDELGSSQYGRDRITLIEGSSVGKTPLSLDFQVTKFDSLFRDTKLELLPLECINGKSATSQPITVVAVPPTISKSGLTRQLSDVEVNQVKDFMPNLPPANAASVSTQSSAKQSPAGTWASTVAKTAPNVAPPTPATTPVANKEAQIPRNRRGQRVDPVIKHDKVEVDRVKKLKMCNVHFLRGECPYGNSCSHVHQYNPSAAELQTLRLVARMAPCMHGSECDDIKCIYGHVCPAPEGRDGKDCIFGEQCRFPAEMHKIDRQIVKTIKV